MKRVWQTASDSKGVPHEFKGYKHGGKNPIIAWFSNKHNQAAGWGIYAPDADDKAWFKSKGESLKNVFRVATDQTTSLVRFNFKGGTVAWFDNEHLLDTDEIRFMKATPYSKVILTKDQRANKLTGLPYNSVPSARLLY